MSTTAGLQHSEAGPAICALAVNAWLYKMLPSDHEEDVLCRSILRQENRDQRASGWTVDIALMGRLKTKR